MPHEMPLVATIVGAIVLAFLLGTAAQRLRVSPLVGYQLAGVLAGPFTPGFQANPELALELAEIGVILLMFGVGLHFSMADLLSVKAIAIPGAVAQIAVATLLGMGLAYFMGWGLGGGVVFGLALSVASTVVLLRALQERRLLESEQGRIAVGWLIVEDLVMVLALVMLPALAGAITEGGGGGIADWLKPLGITILKVAGFVAFMLIVGRRVVPWILHWVVHTGSRELFRLAVLAIALGFAFGAALLFDVSFALGAFFAGMILAESELSQRAAEETLPLRDAFAVLFFVSVGMLFDYRVIFESPWALLGTVAIIVLGKSLAAWAIVKSFRHSDQTAIVIAAALAQIGEFSFILATLGVGLKLLPKEGQDLILAGAVISIMLNPFLFTLFVRKGDPRKPKVAPVEPATDLAPTTLSGHTVIVGLGRVGAVVAEGLKSAAQPFVVVEDRPETIAAGRAKGYEVIDGTAMEDLVLEAAGIGRARRLLIAIPDCFEAGEIVERSRKVNRGIEIVARAHSDAELEHLTSVGADETVMGEREIARRMLERAEAVTPPRPAAPTLADALAVDEPDAGVRPILDDAEAAVLLALGRRGLLPGEAISRRQIYGDPELELFGDARLDQGSATLAEKGLINDLGEGRVALTRTGLVWSKPVV